ncbi:MAG: hypothetical protein OXE04_06520 [bacterium]|nr:hypothetical protein [bacterium]
MFLLKVSSMILSAISVLLIAACSSSTSNATQDKQSADIATKRQYDALISDILLDETVTDHQRLALADGVIELSELESAGLETERCVAESGLANVQFILDPDRVDYKFGYTIPDGWQPPSNIAERTAIESIAFPEEGAAGQVYILCERMHLEAISLQWDWQTLLPADVRKAINEAFESCVEDIGEFDNSDQWLSQEADCWDTAQEEAS